jgi:YfiH family protein
VAAIHAGWRGLSGGIIETTVQALAQKPEDLLVWLGPAIGPQKFEVGQDVYDAFTLQQPESAEGFTPYKEGKWLADLYELARIRLKRLGIAHIYGGDFCTYTQDDLFFSYRRDKGKTGRMASLIWIDNN